MTPSACIQTTDIKLPQYEKVNDTQMHFSSTKNVLGIFIRRNLYLWC